mgnify:FL=1
MRQQVVCGIDVGNYSVKTVIAELTRGSETPRIVGIGNAPSNGLRRGTVIDMEEAIASVKQSVQQAESMAGLRVNRAYVSLNGLHIKTQLSRGVIAVARADNEISQSDIHRLIEAASTVSLPPNYEIIHIIPKNFIIDGHEHVKNALGMKGVRLEAEVLLIEGLSPYIRNLAKCINANDIEVGEFVFAPLAAAKSVLNKHQREYGVLLLDFGGGVSTMALFHEGELMHTAVLPIGSRHVTNDIAIAFRTSIENAEKIKQQYGVVGAPEPGSKKDTINLSDILGEEEFIVPKKHMSKIIDARINELFDIVTTELKKPAGNYLLPAGLVLAGGGSNLSGMPGFARNRLGLSVKLGGDYLFDGVSDSVVDPAFAVAVGLIMWGIENEQTNTHVSPFDKLSGGVFKKAISWIKDFIP